jgi:hypothetical protein
MLDNQPAVGGGFAINKLEFTQYTTPRQSVWSALSRFGIMSLACRARKQMLAKSDGALKDVVNIAQLSSNNGITIPS